MRRIVPGVLLLLAAVGCGSSNSSICDQLADTAHSLNSKYAACGSLGLPDFNKDACKQDFDHGDCTDADRQTFNNFMSCVNALPNCTPATQNSWLNSALTCRDTLVNSLSDNCG